MYVNGSLFVVVVTVSFFFNLNLVGVGKIFNYLEFLWFIVICILK